MDQAVQLLDELSVDEDVAQIIAAYFPHGLSNVSPTTSAMLRGRVTVINRDHANDELAA